MINRLQNSVVLVLSVLCLSLLPACPFNGIGFGNNNDNTNTNDNDNGNANDNDNGNVNDNDNDNGNVNDNGNDNVDDSDFAVFTDPNSDFSTTDVSDVDGETIKFRISNEAIVYQDGTEYQAGLWPVTGDFVGGPNFQVRYGTEDGVHHAYFTEAGSANICNYSVTETTFSISATSTPVPQN